VSTDTRSRVSAGWVSGMRGMLDSWCISDGDCGGNGSWVFGERESLFLDGVGRTGEVLVVLLVLVSSWCFLVNWLLLVMNCLFLVD